MISARNVSFEERVRHKSRFPFRAPSTGYFKASTYGAPLEGSELRDRVNKELCADCGILGACGYVVSATSGTFGKQEQKSVKGSRGSV